MTTPPTRSQPSNGNEVVIRPARTPDAAVLSRLLDTEIPWGRLRDFGPGFLTVLNRAFCESPHSVCFVAEIEGKVVGYCAAAVHLGRFYRWFALRRGFSAALAILPNLFSLHRLQTLLKALAYRGNPGPTGPQAEIALLAVSREFSGRGLGQRLVSSTMDALRARGVDAVRIGTVTEGNDAALKVYTRYGFRVVRNNSIYGDSTAHVMEYRFDQGTQ
jgi:ribosomal protein S18 acetylase RimI-like enzyme